MRPLLSCLLALGLGGQGARAAENPGTTAAPILELPIGARAQGMGGAFTGVADDLTALQYNPAGISSLAAKEAYFMFLKGLEDQNVEYLSFGGPIPFKGFFGSGFAAAAGSILLAQNGTIEVNTTNAAGALTGSETKSAGGDFVGTLGYSERLASTSIDWSRERSVDIHHFLGLNGKFIRSTLASAYSASAWAADVGYMARAPDQGLSAGASLMNVGTRMKFIEEGDPLPLTVRTGASYRIDKPAVRDQSLLLAAGWDYSVYSRQWRVDSGLECQFSKMLRARLGYQWHEDLGGITAGFGIRWQSLTFDYAWSMKSELSDVHRLGVTYRFGNAIPSTTRGKGRRRKIESFPPPMEMRDIEPQQPRNYEPPAHFPKGSRPQDDATLPVWIN